MKKKLVLVGAALVVVLMLVFIGYRELHHNYYEAVTVTGATPLALYSAVPGDFKIEVSGNVKKDYSFGSSALRAFATTRIRTKEVSPAGSFTGIFVYLGIPVYNILEGVAPAYSSEASDNPLDFLVTFESGEGKQVHFSWGELMMPGDAMPVTLAYSRVPVLPAKEREKPDFSPPGEMLTGFRLIAPQEPDTTRYLDGVVRVIFRQVSMPPGLFPERRKGMKCESDRVVCVESGSLREPVWDGLVRSTTRNWVRVGHGRGFLGQETITGYPFREFLLRNFDAVTPRDYFMLVACDGYRVLYAAREILLTDSGRSMVLVDEMNGRRAPGGRMLACLDDYYADRGLWGISHVVRFRLPWDDPNSPAKVDPARRGSGK
ncbi:MAG: hypothetical protein HGA63_09945 [Syntrophobacteraceae bacterium]|nr:hypothetical protein [Syntrophobacteraceae bacterium]